MVNIGERLKCLRLENKYTQKQIADRVGVAISAISSYESGNRYPTYDTLIALSRIYHVSTDYLLGIKEISHVSVDGLNENEIQLILQMIDLLRQKNHIK